MKSTSTRCALLDELRGLDLISMMLYHGAERTAQSLRPLRRSVCPPLGWLGRNSLMLYLLHQPVIYGMLTVVFLLLRRGGGAL